MQPSLEASEPMALTVTHLTQWIRLTLETACPALLWVTGEVSNLAKPRSGHWYFTLKDAESQISCVFFAGSRALQQWVPEPGDQVLIGGRLTVYEARGSYQLMVTHLRPEGLGGLEAAMMAIRDQLASQGLFNPDRKRPIPRYPNRIAVVTSPTGAAIQDVLRTLAQRYPLAEVCVYETAVQGVAAVGSIVAAIKAASNSDCDVVLVVRGGGSLEDLWAYQEAAVAYAIYQCAIPVITGIGHETDLSTADLVADARTSTPTAAAVLAAPDQHHLQALLSRTQEALRTQTYHHWVQKHHSYLTYLAALKHNAPDIEKYHRLLVEYEDILATRVQKQIQAYKQRYLELIQRLSDLNPAQILARGYTLVSDNHNKPIISAKQCQPGEDLFLTFLDGRVVSVVK